MRLAARCALRPLQERGLAQLGTREHLIDEMAPDHNLARQREGHGAGRELRPGELPVVAVGGREDERELELGDAADEVRLVGRLLHHDVGRVHVHARETCVAEEPQALEHLVRVQVGVRWE